MWSFVWPHTSYVCELGLEGHLKRLSRFLACILIHNVGISEGLHVKFDHNNLILVKAGRQSLRSSW